MANSQEPPVSAAIEVGARRTTADIAIQIVGRIANLALGVVVTLVLVRRLGSSGFGRWSTIFAVSQIAANFGELGLSQIAVSRAASEPERESLWLGSLITLRLMLAIPVTLVSAVAVLLIAPTHEAKVAGLLISLALLLGGPAAIGAIFQLRVRNDISTAILTFNSLVWGLAVIGVASASGGIVAFAAAFLAVTAVTNTITIVVALRMVRPNLRGTRQLWSGLARVGLMVGAAGVIITLYVKLDQILVLEFAGSHQAGLYGAAYRILDQVQFIPAAVMTTLFPLIASSYPHNVQRVRDLLQSAGEYLTIASLPILAMTIATANSIVGILFGAQFHGAAPALPILMGAFVAISFGYLAGNMVLILGLQRRFLWFTAVGLVVNAGLNVALIPRYGFLAAAWITLVTEIVVLSLTMRTIVAALEMRPHLGRLLRTVVAAALMGGVARLAQAGGVPFGGVVAVAAASYLTAIWLLRVVSLSEISAILRKDDTRDQAAGA
jgi:O-antigen/teichoic acid export membrane protein